MYYQSGSALNESIGKWRYPDKMTVSLLLNANWCTPDSLKIETAMPE
jgi:hypothetical protein